MADTKQGKQTEDLYNGSPSRIVLAKPKLGGLGSSGLPSSSNKGNSQFGSVLRPPQLKPSCNLFAKITSEEPSEDNKTEESISSPVESTKGQKDDDDKATPKFVPLGNTNVTPKATTAAPTLVSSATTPSVGFVFGQNLSERVVMKEAQNNGESRGDTNGTTALLFTSAAATVKENHQEDPGPGEIRSESLAAAAAEYERSHARPPPPTSDCTSTGEEGETNVLQVTCRLFAWEAGGWRERGRGVLRLNDGAGGGARLVARAAGSLRVSLNTPLWPDMVLELAGAKSLRISAADAQLHVKLFLIMGAPADIARLHMALQVRVARMKTAAAEAEADEGRLRVAPEEEAAERAEAAEADKSLKRKEQPQEGASPKRPCRDECVQ